MKMLIRNCFLITMFLMQAASFSQQSTHGFVLGVKDYLFDGKSLRMISGEIVFLNGHNFGKYWQIGLQQTLYIPAVWLKTRKNDISVFDQLKDGHTNISALKEPNFERSALNYHNA